MALRIERNIMVPTRDGVHLATDVYRPADASGPMPALLERTPYGKQDLERMRRGRALRRAWLRRGDPGLPGLPFLRGRPGLSGQRTLRRLRRRGVDGPPGMV